MVAAEWEAADHPREKVKARNWPPLGTSSLWKRSPLFFLGRSLSLSVPSLDDGIRGVTSDRFLQLKIFFQIINSLFTSRVFLSLALALPPPILLGEIIWDVGWPGLTRCYQAWPHVTRSDQATITDSSGGHWPTMYFQMVLLVTSLFCRCDHMVPDVTKLYQVWPELNKCDQIQSWPKNVS